MRKIIINCCLTGMIPQKEDNQYVPITPEEIADAALSAATLGASVVHIHPRDKDGKPTWKKDIFKKIIHGIREKNKDLILSVTTSGRHWSDFEKRAECLSLKGDLIPDLASLTVGSFNFMKDMSINHPEIIEKLAYEMVKNGIKPEIEIFELGMLHKANFLIEKGIIPKSKPYFNLFFGSLGTAPLHVSSLSSFLSILPDEAIWSAAGLGRFQLDANVLGLSLGGHVRVGLEDNIFYDRKRNTLASNQMQIERLTRLIKELELEVASPKEAREILNLI